MTETEKPYCEVICERDRLLEVAKELSEAIKAEMEFPNTGPGKTFMRNALRSFEAYKQDFSNE